MVIDDSVVSRYLAGDDFDTYSDSWIFKDSIFEVPDPLHRGWVSLLRDKLVGQIEGFVPCNYGLAKTLFPCFDDVARDYTIMLVVGFPYPYDAMVRNHNGVDYMIFDLIRFGQGALDDNYSCHRILTHELIHICLHKRYPEPVGVSYLEALDYLAFDEGFAHALSYPADIGAFQFDDFLEEKFKQARSQLKLAMDETNLDRQKEYLVCANSGQYWNKFGSISGKLFVLKNLDRIEEIYNGGWVNFCKKIT